MLAFLRSSRAYVVGTACALPLFRVSRRGFVYLIKGNFQG
ncbi:hypothetical protein STRIP9103_05369 [Streptomyces ipomoeae 91-03]|uniref:Uncharacterized protein n=1 Tax=Streptomyces ipomoeae 91-03 TaxID=698759 RepID=L1L2M1_9ACTN|nr:hypothetical protein STRIP9103_05369 [Streptomyces ipomoeae 91-03]